MIGRSQWQESHYSSRSTYLLQAQSMHALPAKDRDCNAPPRQVQNNLSHTVKDSADVQQSNPGPRQAQPCSVDPSQQPSVLAASGKGGQAQLYGYRDAGPPQILAGQRKDQPAQGSSDTTPAVVEVRGGSEPAQFMSALSGLYGSTTPEQKRQREDKQKQYAHDLDEQVGDA